MGPLVVVNEFAHAVPFEIERAGGDKLPFFFDDDVLGEPAGLFPDTARRFEAVEPVPLHERRAAIEQALPGLARHVADFTDDSDRQLCFHSPLHARYGGKFPEGREPSGPANLALPGEARQCIIRVMVQSGFYKTIDKQRIIEGVEGEGFDPVCVSDPPGNVYPSHRHVETKLIVLLEGSMEVRVRGASLQCKPGDKLIIPGNTGHSAVAGPDGCFFLWSEKL